jgi:Uma2 family endonuclease
MLMRTSREATFDDLCHVEGRAEIVNGRIVMLDADGFAHARAAMYIVGCLQQFEKRTRSGYAMNELAKYRVFLPHRQSLCPDGSFYVGPPEGDKSPNGPLFAVEVRSPGDYGMGAERSIAWKRAEYFAANTQIVWDVDLFEKRCIRSFRKDAPDTPEIFKEGEAAHAEPALPGWRLSVDEVLEEAFPKQ